MGSVLSLPFVHLGVDVACSNCGRYVPDVYAENVSAAAAGRGWCTDCAVSLKFEADLVPLPESQRAHTAAALAAEERAAARALRRAQRAAEEAAPADGTPPQADAVPVLKSLKVVELRALAAQRQIAGSSSMTKAQLLEALQE